MDWTTAHEPDIAPDGPAPVRSNYQQVLLRERLTKALRTINPGIPSDSLEETIDQVEKLDHPALEWRNRDFHRLLVDGIPVRWQSAEEVEHDYVRLIDFENVANNDFLVVNQFTVKGAQHVRRPDLVAFINGIPIAVIELKNPADEEADVWSAHQQLQTYKEQIPDLFAFNEALVVSDGLTARIGSLTASKEWFLPWRALSDAHSRPQVEYELENVVRGFFDRELLLDYLRYFVLFEQEGEQVVKKIAGYHQFHAVREAVRVTVVASQAPEGEAVSDVIESYGREVLPGSRKAGVVWHTQGAGKSISMVCYAAKLLQQSEMKNPTIVVVTDRIDLDSQLFETFCLSQDLLKQTPIQVESRAKLRERLTERQAGGIIFTTVQKFSLAEGEKQHRPLCNRSNVVVISDEAHRSQYGLKARLDKKKNQYVFGFAKHMRDALPNASFIGFTGTPISQDDRDTRAVFGDYVSIYDIQDAVDDGATVEIYYESRLVKLDVNRKEIDRLSEEVEVVTEEEEDLASRERTKATWTALAKLVGAEERLKELAADLVEHFEKRTSTIEGKAMIVCMRRSICAQLFAEIVALRPDWMGSRLADRHGNESSFNPEDGTLRVVMSGSSSDAEELRPHVYTRQEKKRLEKRFKDPTDPLKLVIVRDMWLTGFDVPCCHTMYVDKPMREHNLMQAIARVNRVFKDKTGGLVVDYIGIARDLKAALKTYTESKGRGRPTRNAEEALGILVERLDVCRGMFHGFDYSRFETDATNLLVPAANHVLGLQDGKKRFIDVVAEMTKVFSVCGTLDDVVSLRTEIAFFSAVKAAIVKYTTVDRKLRDAERDSTLKQILDNAVVSDGVTDIFKLAGLEKPNIGLLSDEFLEDVRNMPEKDLGVQLLEKLLRDGIRTYSRNNIVQQQTFSERLLETLRKYHNRAIETAQVVEELINMSRDFQDAMKRDEELGLSVDEVAFYYALAKRPEVLKEMGDKTLKKLATELTEKLRNSTSVDWQHRESVRARMRILIKRLLRKYKYPPEGQDDAVVLVVEQAEELADKWSSELQA